MQMSCSALRLLPSGICIVYHCTIVKSADYQHAADGYLMIVLHAHLPFIRYPEHEHFLEENWLFEALTETYLPLITIFENLVHDKVDFRITLSLSPPLIEMLNDDLLLERYQRYLCSRIALSEKELFRNRKDVRFRDLAKMYHRRFLTIQHSFENTYKKDLLSAFRKLMETGRVEIMTSSATHAYLPALMIEPSAATAQIQLAVAEHKKFFDRKPSGIWLPECGFSPPMDTLLKAAGFRFFFLESHGVVNTSPESRRNIYAPVRTPSGLTIFARDTVSSRQVWSAQEGYPGDPAYRDFYRDIGFDLGYDYIHPYLPDGIRTFTGIKYFRITSRTTDRKSPYNREKALQKAKVHAGDFLRSRERQIRSLNRTLKIRPLITAPFDAELFGHWWFEGPEWLDHLFRRSSGNGKSVRFITPAEFIAENPAAATLTPSLSSWGLKGYSETWIDASNSWVYKHMHRAAKQMTGMARQNRKARGFMKRALNQAARELLLAQASDWTFMMQKGTTAEFAKRKFTDHISNFAALHHAITSGKINRTYLVHLEQKNNIFANIDFRVYAGDKDRKK